MIYKGTDIEVIQSIKYMGVLILRACALRGCSCGALHMFVKNEAFFLVASPLFNGLDGQRGWLSHIFNRSTEDGESSSTRRSDELAFEGFVENLAFPCEGRTAVETDEKHRFRRVCNRLLRVSCVMQESSSLSMCGKEGDVMCVSKWGWMDGWMEGGEKKRLESSHPNRKVQICSRNGNRSSHDERRGSCVERGVSHGALDEEKSNLFLLRLFRFSRTLIIVVFIIIVTHRSRKDEAIKEANRDWLEQVPREGSQNLDFHHLDLCGRASVISKSR